MDYETKVIERTDYETKEVDIKKKNKIVDYLHKTKNRDIVEDMFVMIGGKNENPKRRECRGIHNGC